MPPSIAVVGAGVAGLACARLLQDSGAQVTIFEQATRAGGRLATRRTELGGFDVGAQYFTCSDDAFARAARQWISAGVCAAWQARVAHLSTSPHGTNSGSASALPGQGDARERIVGVPAMATLATHLADGLDVRCEQRIRRLEALGHDHPPRWTLKRAADAGDPHSIEVTEGIFEAVVVATPPPLAMPLLEGCTQRFGELRAVSMEPCFALLLGFSAPLELDFDAAHVDGPRLAWIARDSAKPQRRPGEHWIAHATWAWSREHFDDDPEDVRAKLVKAFGEACGTPAQPIYSSVYRWTYSVAARPLPQPFLWESSERLGVCGDWCGGGRVESAWLSGRALGVAIIESLRLSR